MPMMAYVRNGSYNSDRRSVNTDFKLIYSHIKSIRWVMFFLAFLASFFTKKRQALFSFDQYGCIFQSLLSYSASFGR